MRRGEDVTSVWSRAVVTALLCTFNVPSVLANGAACLPLVVDPGGDDRVCLVY